MKAMIRSMPCHAIPSIYLWVNPWTHLNPSYGCLVDSKWFNRSDFQHGSTCNGTSFQEPFAVLLNDRRIRETLENTGTHKGGPFPREQKEQVASLGGSVWPERKEWRLPGSLFEAVLWANACHSLCCVLICSSGRSLPLDDASLFKNQILPYAYHLKNSRQKELKTGFKQILVHECS